MSEESNTRGNQSNYRLNLSEEGPQTIGDLYSPGYPDSGNEPKDTSPTGRVGIGTGHDISQAAKVTLGSYLSAATRGSVYNARPNAFQVPEGSDPIAAGVDPNASSKRPVLARFDIESNGTTVGTYLDHAKGHINAGLAARKFESTKDSDYGPGIENPFLGPDIDIKNYSDLDARRRGQDGNSILLNVEPRGSQSSAEPGNPNIGPLRDSAPIVQKKISEVLKQNRFNPIEKAFVQNHTWTGTGVTLQRRLGVHEKDNGKDVKQGLLEQVGLKLMIRATGHSVPGQDLLDSTNDLRLTNNLAPLIPSAPQLTGLPLIDVINLRAGNVAVAEDILGVGVTPESARAEYINDVSFDVAEGSIGSTQSGIFVGKSYGVLNSHIEPFAGALPIGTFTTTVAGIIAILGASFLVAALPLLLGGNTQVTPRASTFTRDPSTLIKGKRGFIGSEPDSYGNDNIQEYVFSLLGIPKTDHNWGQCLLVGISSFFGVEINVIAGTPTIDEGSILQSLFDIVTAPGYYAVIIRNAIRDTEQIVRAIEEFAQSAGDVNVVRAISGLFKVIESITTSSLYRFIMAMTSLGNQVLNSANTRSFSGISLESAIDTNEGLAELRMRSRLSDDPADRDREGSLPGDLGRKRGSALAWKHSSPASNYLLPQKFISTSESATQTIGYRSADPRLAGGELRTKPGISGRISKEDVQIIEEALEAEYVPFYFHDLRTNEVISFHAFLSDLSDGFSAQYNSTAGYGRADEVMVYNSTKRSISLAFTVAATSPEDFDVMYWNINKLVTMLYPQYSRGRVMVSGEQKFIQPFSQIPTASPMIRLRVGDIIKGNYSKFGLARLFGLGQGPEAFNIQEVPEAAATERARRTAARPAAVAAVRDRSYGVGDRVVTKTITRDSVILCDSTGQSAGQISTQRRRGRTVQVIAPRGNVPPSLAESISRGSGKQLPEGTIARIIQIISPVDPAIVDFLSPLGDGAAGLDTMQTVYLLEITQLGGSSDDAARTALISTFNPYNYVYVARDDLLGYSPEYENQLIEDRITSDIGEAPGPSPTAGPDAVTNFFSPTNNPLVRSFESSRGRGLAGFITDLKMDWQDSTWEISRGKRAPMSMKLSISFSPIHDIPMGLDSDGMMRSVAYNIGNMSKAIGSDPYEGETTPSPISPETPASTSTPSR